MTNENQIKQKENISDVLKKYKETTGQITNKDIPKPTSFNQQEFERNMSKETDPDLMTTYEIVTFPSHGLF